MSIRHLNQNQLAERWNISPRTLERWRWLGQGPVYLKLGGRVSYRLEDIEQYETHRLHANTNGPLAVEATGRIRGSGRPALTPDRK
jgi:hypothetical protein